MDRYKIPCTVEQTKKALKLGAPIILESEYYTPTENDIKLDNPIPCESYTCGYHYAKCTTAEQMIGWLEEQGLCIDTETSWSGRFTMWVWHNAERKHVYTSNTNSRQEATIAVIDAALDYLDRNKKINTKDKQYGETKFNAGNTAWCILHNRIVPVIIRGRKIYNDKSLYSVVTILPYSYLGADDLYYTTIFETELSRTPEEFIEKVKSMDFTKMLSSVMKRVQELENK